MKMTSNGLYSWTLWSTFLLTISTRKKFCRHPLQTLKHLQGLIFSLTQGPCERERERERVTHTHTHTHTHTLVSIYSKWDSWFWNVLWLRLIKARWQCYPWKDPYCPVAHFSAPYFHPHTSVFLQPSILLPQARVPESESFWACSSALKQCVRSRQRRVSTSSSVVISAGHTEGNSDGNWYNSSSGKYNNKILLKDFSQMSCLKEQSSL